MQLPKTALTCIQRLEQAGFHTYAVGGCVRDALLGLTPHDYDLCTAATPAEISHIFQDFPQIHAGEKHGTVGIIFPDKDVYEITTFRTEGGYTDSRHPDWVEFVSDVESDLARRDFTVNAMAYSPCRGIIDPFGGQADLKNKRLRAVGDPHRRFSEDALRILRGVRFSVTYDLTPETETLQAMETLSPLMDSLARERVFEELCKLLPRINARQMCRFAPILTQVIPPLKASINFDQRNPHHIHDVYTHTAHVLERTPPDLTLRWAALLHDVGKPDTFTLDETGCGHFYGHAKRSAQLADEILLALKAPTALRQQVVLLVQLHMTTLSPDKKSVRRQLSRLGSQTLEQLLILQQADMGGDPTFAQNYRGIMAEILAENACLQQKDLAINGHDLIAAGYRGRQIGQILAGLLDAVLEEQVENTRLALLEHIPHLKFEEKK